MAADQLSSGLLSDKVKIGGRDIPIVVIGGGIGLVAGVAFLITRRGGSAADSIQNPAQPVSGAENGQFGVDEGRFTLFQSTLTNQVNQSLSDQAAAMAGQFAGLQSGFDSQFSGQQQSIAGVTTNVNQLQQSYTALVPRVVALETKSARIDLLSNAVRRLGTILAAVVTGLPTVASNTNEGLAKREMYQQDTLAALQPIGGSLQ